MDRTHRPVVGEGNAGAIEGSQHVQGAAANESFFQKHHYLLRRLHSLTGVVPVGVFMIIHLVTNSSIVWGQINGGHYPGMHAGTATFQHEVNFIHSLPFLILIEVFGLWLPIAFHSILGFYYATTGKGNAGAYPYQSNWRYSLQRISGYIGFLFVVYHVATLRWGWTWLVPGGTEWKADFAASTMAQALQGSADGLTVAGMIVSAFYMAGVTLLSFHLANGLWTAAITWGLTISQSAQRRWGYVCAGIGAGLIAASWAAVIGFMTLDAGKARATEEQLLRGKAVETAPAQTLTSTTGAEASR